MERSGDRCGGGAEGGGFRQGQEDADGEEGAGAFDAGEGEVSFGLGAWWWGGGYETFMYVRWSFWGVWGYGVAFFGNEGFIHLIAFPITFSFHIYIYIYLCIFIYLLNKCVSM